MTQHYRPIAILPVLSKALERVACEQIRGHLEGTAFLDPCQFAYRGNYSTQTCLIRMLDDIRQAADLRMVTVSVFFDFSKAFDRVDWLTLLGKLKTLKFSDSVLQWIFSYLTDRSQCVRNGVTGATSSLTSVWTGVPQGSVLGPLLFTLYLSDFRHVLTHCKYNYYADDLQIYYHCRPRELASAIRSVNEDINSVIRWAAANKLILNADKTQTIIFGTSRYINALDVSALSSIVVGGTPVHYSTSVKYLGVMVANNLSWEKQVCTTGRIRSVLYRLKLSKHLFPMDLRHRLITSLIIPHIDYCCAAFTDMTAKCDLKLYRAINGYLRFVFDVRSDVHITPYYHKLKMLKIGARRDYFVGCQLFNLRNCIAIALRQVTREELIVRRILRLTQKGIWPRTEIRISEATRTPT